MTWPSTPMTRRSRSGRGCPRPRLWGPSGRRRPCCGWGGTRGPSCGRRTGCLGSAETPRTSWRRRGRTVTAGSASTRCCTTRCGTRVMGTRTRPRRPCCGRWARPTRRVAETTWQTWPGSTASGGGGTPRSRECGHEDAGFNDTRPVWLRRTTSVVAVVATRPPSHLALRQRDEGILRHQRGPVAAETQVPGDGPGVQAGGGLEEHGHDARSANAHDEGVAGHRGGRHAGAVGGDEVRAVVGAPGGEPGRDARPRQHVGAVRPDAGRAGHLGGARPRLQHGGSVRRSPAKSRRLKGRLHR